MFLGAVAVPMRSMLLRWLNRAGREEEDPWSNMNRKLIHGIRGKKRGGCKIRAAKIMVNLRSHWAKERGRNLLRSESRGTTGEHEIQAFIAVCCLTTVMVCSEPIPILLVSGSKQRERKRPPRLLQEAMDVTMEEGLNATATTTP